MKQVAYGKLQVAAATTTRHIFVKDNGSGKLTPTDAVDDVVVGVLSEKYDAADAYANTILSGVVKVLGEGTGSAFDLVGPSASGVDGAAEAAATTGDTIAGMALQDWTDGQEFYMLLFDDKNGTVA